MLCSWLSFAVSSCFCGRGLQASNIEARADSLIYSDVGNMRNADKGGEPRLESPREKLC